MPPATWAWLTLTEESDGFVPVGKTGKLIDCVTPPPVAVIVTIVVAATGLVRTGKPPRTEPAGTTTDVGTETTAGLLLVSWKVWS